MSSANTTPQEWQPTPPPPPKKTKWTNLTKMVLFVEFPWELVPPKRCVAIDEHTGERRTWEEHTEIRRVTWQPGQSIELPSTLDRTIHQVDCKHEGQHAICKRRGYWCTMPDKVDHPHARVVGGLGPLLQREGQKYGIEKCLIPRTRVVTKSDAVAPGDVNAFMASGDEDPAVARVRREMQK